MKNCKICKTKTKNIFNIDFVATPICDDCADAIMLQNAVYYVKQRKNEKNRISK